MNNGSLTKDKVKWLTYLVYFLLVVLTCVVGYNRLELSDIPHKYLRLEEFRTYQGRTFDLLDRIDDKITKLLENSG